MNNYSLILSIFAEIRIEKNQDFFIAIKESSCLSFVVTILVFKSDFLDLNQNFRYIFNYVEQLCVSM